MPEAAKSRQLDFPDEPNDILKHFERLIASGTI